MNILTTKHQTHQVDQMTKGQTLGKVGVIMIFSFVGLIFATTLVAVRAAINNEIVHITQTNNQLIAEANYEDLGNSSLRWQWFSIPTGTGSNFNNSDYFSQRCRQVDSEDLEVLDEGTGSRVAIEDDDLNNLYCFSVSVIDGDALNIQAVDYGGYIPE